MSWFILDIFIFFMIINQSISINMWGFFCSEFHSCWWRVSPLFHTVMCTMFGDCARCSVICAQLWIVNTKLWSKMQWVSGWHWKWNGVISAERFICIMSKQQNQQVHIKIAHTLIPKIHDYCSRLSIKGPKL